MHRATIGVCGGWRIWRGECLGNGCRGHKPLRAFLKHTDRLPRLQRIASVDWIRDQQDVGWADNMTEDWISPKEGMNMNNSPANVTGGGRYRNGSRLLHGCLRVLGAALVVGGVLSGASAGAQPIVVVSADANGGMEGDPAVFEFRRSGNPTGDLTVAISVQDPGSRIMGTAPTEVEIEDGDSTATLSIATVDDAVDEPDSSITVTVAAGTGYRTPPNPALGTAAWLVMDNDGAGPPTTPTVSIEAGTSPVGEGTAADFTLTRSDSAGALTVNVDVSESGMMIDGTAPTTVEFAAGAMTAMLSVPTEDDGVDEAASIITATVAMGTGYDPGTPDSAMVTVTDDDDPAPGAITVSIAAGTSPVGEGTAADFTLTRSDSAGALTVNVNVSESGMMIDGTAPATVEFADGDAMAMLSVPTEDDDVDEPNSDVTATVATGVGYVPGSPDSAMVTVTDDDDPMPGVAEVTIAAGNSPVREGSPASFTLTRTDSVGALTVNVDVMETGDVIDGTAPTTVTFADGMATAALSVATENDDVDEEDSYVTATVAAGQGYQPGSGHGSSAVVRVSDDDGRPSSVNTVLIRVSLSNREVVEGADAVFSVYRRDAFKDQALTVTLDVTESGDVINMAPTSVDFAVGETTATFAVTTVNDDIVEDDSVITATLVPMAGYDVRSGPTAMASVTVTSEDTGDDPGPGEPDPNRPSAPRQLEPTSGDHEVALYWIPPTDDGGSPITGYEVRVNGMGDWTSVGDSTTRRHTVMGLANDQSYTFEVRAVNAAGGGAAAGPVTATPVGPRTEVTIAANASEVTEGDDVVFTIQRHVFGRHDLLEGRIRVMVTEERDWPSATRELVSETEQFVSFDKRQTTAEFTVATVQNDLDEPNSIFTVQVIDQFDPGYQLPVDLSTASAMTTVLDDDPTPQVSIADMSAGEETGEITFTVSLVDAEGDPAKSAFDITVDWATGDASTPDDPYGMATAGVDYTVGTGDTITFASGTTEQTFTVTVEDDALDEHNEAFVVTLSNPTSTGSEMPTILNAEATGTIEDDDAPPSVTIADMTVGEADGMVTLTAMLSAPSGLPVRLDMATGDVPGLGMYDMAVGDVDYTSASGVLEFLPADGGLGGPTEQMTTVDVLTDDLDERDEQFAVTLAAQVPEYVMDIDDMAVVTITDDDDPPSLSIADMMAMEDSGGVTFTLTLDAPSGLPIELNWMTGDHASEDPWGMAMGSGDYADYMAVTEGMAALTPDMAGAAGPTTTTITVDVTADTFDEHDEVFGVMLTAAMPEYVMVADGMAVGTIQDDDDPPAVSVASSSADEGAGELMLEISLSGESGLPINVDWMTGDAMTEDEYGMAMSAGERADYTPVGTTTVDFMPHETAKSVGVAIVDDGFDEHDEVFMVTLDNAMYATLGEASATATIVDNDDPPTIDIHDGVAKEDSGELIFMLTLDGESGLPISAHVATGDVATPLDEWGMATAGEDYTVIDQMYTIDPHETQLAVTVMLEADMLDEHPEQFSATLGSVMYAMAGDTYAVGVIQDDDAAPSLSISDETGMESDGPLTFTVSLSQASGLPISVSWSTGDASMTGAENLAIAGEDYTAGSGLLEFAPGEMSMTVDVEVLDDMIDEHDESFAVNLNDGMYATLGDAQGIGTIEDDDDAPAISVADGEASEGDGLLTFTVSLDAPSGLTVSVDWSTGDIEVPEGDHTAAMDGSDYTAGSGTLEFEPGTQTMTVDVPLLDDALNEMTEQFSIVLENPMYGTFEADADAITAIGTITDDDDAPHVSIADARDDEGAGSLSFRVTLSAPSALPISVDWATGDAATEDMYGMATADMDYTSGGGTLDFAAGETEMMVSVAVMDDALDEHDEVFGVMLSNAMNAMLDDAMAMGTIVDNDAAPSLSIADASGGEGEGDLSFMVSLSAESALPISVDWATADMATPGDMYGMATADTDYTSGSGTLNFEPGMTSMAVAVAVMDDMIDEHDEVFAVNLSGAAYATLDDGSATGTIEDDDDAPSVSIADASGSESVGNMDFAVTLSGMSGLPVMVDWATASGTAKAGEDYENADGTLTIAAGDTAGTVSIAIVADNVHEAEETFSVNLSGAMYSMLADASATGTITDDDAAPTLAIADAGAHESDGAIHFTISLTGATALPASVSWATSPGTATAGSDYQSGSGSITFEPGESRDAVVAVTIMEDELYEGVETFSVNLSGASNSTVSTGTATGTISDNDSESIAKEWLARFGRTVASHVVDAVDTRLNHIPSGSNGSEFRLSGIWSNPAGSGPAGLAGFGPAPIAHSTYNPGFNPAYDDVLASQTTPYGMSRRFGDPSLGRMMAGSSFRFSAANGDSSDEWTLWGRGATTSFSGEGDTLSHDGSVTTGTVGVDYTWGDVIGGVALSHSAGDGEFEVGSAVAGELDSSMTLLSPYVRFKMSCCVTFWGVAGVGAGDMTLAADGGGAAIDTDISMSMGAAGFRGGILPDAGTFDLALKSDVFVARMSADAAPGLSAVDADASRLRVAIEGSSNNQLDGGGTFTPVFQAGLRYDGGDAESGAGLELGGGLRFADASRRIMLELNARGMLAHADGDYQEWGVGASVLVRPNASGQGMTMNLRSTWGDMASGVDALWNRHNAEILARADRSLATRVGARYDAELGYGLNALSGRNVLVPYVGAGFTDYGSRDYRMGVRLRSDSTMNFSFEVDRREGWTETPDYGASLRAWMYW